MVVLAERMESRLVASMAARMVLRKGTHLADLMTDHLAWILGEVSDNANADKLELMLVG
jgi:hypothetical protein